MSEDLIVTLGLQDKGATKQITALNKEIRYLDKEFKNTTRASKTYEMGTATLQRQLSLLEKKYEANKLKLNAYKKKVDETKEKLSKKKAELEKLTNAENVNEKSVEKCTNQIKNMEETLRKTEREIGLTEEELSQLSDEIDNTNNAIKTKPLEDYKKKMADMGKKVEEAGEKVSRTGEQMSNVGGKMQQWSAPFVDFGVASSKMYLDFKDNMGNINTLLDDTKNLQGYENAVKRFSNETGINIGVMADGMYQAISSLGDLGEETEKIFNIMSRSAKAGKADVSDSVSLISAGMKGFGSVNEETAKKISDLAFQTAKLGVTTFPEMAKSMKPLFPLANSLSMSLEEVFGVMATGTGVVGNTSEVSTQFKAVMSNLLKPTTEMTNLLKKYGFNSGEAMIKSKGLTGTLEILKNETGGNADKMAKLFSSTEALTLMTALCGEQFEVFKEKSSSMNNSMGATDTAFAKVSSTTKDKLLTNINKLKNSFMEAGEKLMPFIDKAVDGIGRLADWISKLDGETIKTIATTAMWTMAIGTGLKIAGGFAQNIGSLISLFGRFIPKVATSTKEGGLFSKVLGLVGKNKSTASTLETITKGTSEVGKASITAAGVKGLGGFLNVGKLFSPVGLAIAGGAVAIGTAMKIAKTNTDLYSKSTTTAHEDLSTFEKIIAKFNGTTFKTRKELEELNLVNKDFSEGISEEFQKAVEIAEEKSNQFKFEISKMNSDGVISKVEHENFKTAVTELCDSAINAVKTKSNEQQTALKQMFKTDGILTEEESRTLTALEKLTNSVLDKINERKEKILEIERKALERGDGLREEEKQKIIENQDAIRQLELEALGATQEEILYAKNEFSARLQTMSSEEATKLLEQKRKEIDEQKIEIQAGYDTRISMLEGQIEKLDGKEKEAAQKALEDLIKSKGDKLMQQEDLWNEYLRLATEGNENLQGVINKYTGQELTEADIKKQALLEKWKTQYEGLGEITESGSYRIYNTQTQSYRNLEIEVDKYTGEIIGIYDHQSNKTAAYSEEIAESIKGVGREHGSASNVIAEAFRKSGKASVDASGRIKDSNGKIVGSLKDVKKGANGTASAIIDLNGEKIEIKTNADGTISKMQNVKKSIDNIPARKEVTIWQRVKNLFTGGNDGKGGEGKSIMIPQSGAVAGGIDIGIQPIGGLSDISFTPSLRELPSTYNNMIIDPNFYSMNNPKLNKSNQNSNSKGDFKVSNTNYTEIGNLIGKAVIDALSNIQIENIVNANIEGKPLVAKVSNEFARNIRGRRR